MKFFTYAVAALLLQGAFAQQSQAAIQWFNCETGHARLPIGNKTGEVLVSAEEATRKNSNGEVYKLAGFEIKMIAENDHSSGVFPRKAVIRDFSYEPTKYKGYARFVLPSADDDEECSEYHFLMPAKFPTSESDQDVPDFKAYLRFECDHGGWTIDLMCRTSVVNQ